ncbi:hypothetical protein CHLRE_12g555450v5 [Chlamydomonas reinhardtii]|uniref:Inositol polyphosphate multikinase n=1 Tax=Chlamydomonas reinhardtii TaxID=3055 RepID=A8IYR0_CHLRE|nr:uncharacterized protein CHLRE_12g555450v5 [Chlamydomonas reinhardtii]PNW75907.1 hypothetical protein CHLRE_12g555450v5 [Chlamydomonas reinhardtii]|eukprot:XP_001694168.1 inositol polyphosphate kinase [Chlamydomonas reinhardtii]
MAATVDVERPVDIGELDLRPCEHQAGGHFASEQGKAAGTFVDSSGKFYKAFQDDIRGGREAAVYELIFGDADESVRKEDMEQLRRFVPKYFGTLVSDGKKLLALEDTCKAYTKPCVLDCKMGMTTIYDWAEDKYKTKNAGKDTATTQASLGYRVTGFKVWQQAKAEYFFADRHYGKKLTDGTMAAALATFANNGAIGPDAVYGGPNGAVAQIRALQSWFESQRSLVFFAASILVIYEGAATRPEDANVTIRFIDFAHTFPSKGQADANVTPAVKSLADLMEQVATGQAS